MCAAESQLGPDMGITEAEDKPSVYRLRPLSCSGLMTWWETVQDGVIREGSQGAARSEEALDLPRDKSQSKMTRVMSQPGQPRCAPQYHPLTL